MLSLKVSMEAHEQHHNAYTEERCAEGFAHLSEMFVGVSAAILGGCSVKSESVDIRVCDRREGSDLQLCDCNPNRSKSQRSSQPSKERPF